MGFESVAAGYIAISASNAYFDRDQLLSSVQKHIQGLPILKNDTWPFLPREAFSISIPEEGSNPVQISYRSIIVHFGMSVKQLEGELENWLNKFEAFMKTMPGARESLLHIKLIPYTGNYMHKHLSYRWHKKFHPQSSDTYWVYEGDPRNWDELLKKHQEQIK